MAINIKGIEREFEIETTKSSQIIPDPDPELEPEEIMNLLANQYPELNNARVDGPRDEDNKVVYKFTTTFGNKG